MILGNDKKSLLRVEQIFKIINNKCKLNISLKQ